jgi:multimeric flavodoxin WrbA
MQPLAPLFCCLGRLRQPDPSAKDILLKIINIIGSPRKNGASARIARSFIETAAVYDAEITEYPLNNMQYRGCQACEGCHTRADRCVLRDELTPALDDLYAADVVVLSTPIYFGDVCGQFKTFFDRMWSLIQTDAASEDENDSRLPPGKVAVLILTQVDAAGAHNDVAERYAMYLTLFGFEIRTIVASSLRLQSNADVDAQISEAASLARELLLAE